MENPATWNDDVKAIADSLKAHGQSLERGVVGHSLPFRIDMDVVSPIRNKLSYILRVLDVLDKEDCQYSLMWRVKDDDPHFAINCSDVFFWGCADAEELTPERLPILEQALKDAGDDGPHLYCARIRKMRPQGAVYEHIDKENWPLFDACGELREVGLGNPRKHPTEE